MTLSAVLTERSLHRLLLCCPPPFNDRSSRSSMATSFQASERIPMCLPSAVKSGRGALQPVHLKHLPWSLLKLFRKCCLPLPSFTPSGSIVNICNYLLTKSYVQIKQRKTNAILIIIQKHISSPRMPRYYSFCWLLIYLA